MTIKNLFPTSRPTLDLNFAKTKRLDGRITFTRSSTGTYFDSGGILRTAAVNTARFDHNPATGESLGLLVEESRTNLLQYSSRFEFDTQTYWNWGVVNPIKIPNYTTAPDGNLTAYQVNFGQLANPQGWANTYLRYYVGGLTNGTTYTFTLYVKSASTSPASNIRVTFNNGQTWTGATSQKFTISNSWQRIQLSRTADSSGVILIHVGAITAVPDFDADCYGNVLIWGGQFEAGSFPTSYISSLETFTSRASTATYYDASGTVQTAASGVARDNAYFPDSSGTMRSAGLLLETAATNLVTYSEQFDNTAWTKFSATVTANTTTAPDGLSTADKLVETATNAEHLVYAVTSGANPTFSCFVKAAGRNFVNFRLYINSSQYVYATFSLVDGSVTVQPTIVGTTFSAPIAKSERLGNSWFRLSLSASCTSQTILPAIDISDVAVPASRNSGAPPYLGDGTSGIFLWGAQMESSPYATSYIPTVASTVTRAADVSTSATVTRSADVASITGTNFSNWFNQTSGTFYTETSATSYQQALWRFQNSTRWYAIGSTANFYSELYDFAEGGGAVTAANGQASSSKFKMVATVDNTSLIHKACMNGGVVTPSSYDYQYNHVQLTIGFIADFPLYMNSRLSRLTYWPTRLSDATLQALTQ